MRRPALAGAVIAASALLTACSDGGGARRDASAAPGDADGGGSAAVIDVRVRGAAGDGIADDTDVLAAALADGAASGITVHLPDGSYRVTRPLQVELGELRVTAGTDAVITSALSEPAGDGEAEVAVLEARGAGTVSIEGLAVQHSATGRGLVDGILVVHAGRADLSRVRVAGAARWGVALDRVAGGHLADCAFVDNRYGGLGLVTSSDVLIEGGSFSQNGTVLVEDGYGIALASSAFGPSRGVTISGVVADGNLRKGLDVHSGHDVLIEGNTVRGFGMAGIYAVNEDAGKDVADIVIADNLVDGLDAAQPILGIDIGAYSAAALPSGHFEVRRNRIRNTSSPASTAILVRNPQAGGAPTTSVRIHDNHIADGAGPDAYAIRTDNDAVPIGSVTVTDNRVHARSALVVIGVLAAGGADVAGNQLVTDTGTAAYGIIVAPPAGATITGNQLSGSYETPIATFDGQSASGNSLNGAPL